MKITKQLKKNRSYIRAKMYKAGSIGINGYDHEFLRLLLKRELEVNKDLYENTWNIKLWDIFNSGVNVSNYFEAYALVRKTSKNGSWIPEEITKIHTDILSGNLILDADGIVIFESRNVKITHCPNNMLVTMQEKKDNVILPQKWSRLYTLEELPIFKQIAEQMTTLAVKPKKKV